ncbi:MAG TPA: hypothetical protein VM848_03135 [Acidimicrobiia bacterium]|nr:hypothetical protein [Acidimicrobiia bacterium]
MATRSKPVGLIIVGVVLVGSALILVLTSIGLTLGDVLVIDNTPPTWVLLGGAAIGLTAAYLALRIGFGLFANPAKNRKATEKALWLGLPVVWMAMVGVNLLLTGGQDDVAVWPLIAMSGVLWSAIVIAAAFYMRSRRVRVFFAEVA